MPFWLILYPQREWGVLKYGDYEGVDSMVLLFTHTEYGCNYIYSLNYGMCALWWAAGSVEGRHPGIRCRLYYGVKYRI
jgi:hypothetical protein